jgi:acetyl esterase/lipase
VIDALDSVRTGLPELLPQQTVLILGWGGAKPRHLARLKRVYEALGCRPNVVITPLARLLRPRAVTAADRQWVQATWAMTGDNAGILVHAHSFNGAIALMRLMEETSPADRNRVIGVIFDSGPGLLDREDFHPNHFARSLATAFAAMLRPRSRLLRAVVGVAASAIAHGWTRCFKATVHQYYTRYADSLIHGLSGSLPILLLYGECDTVTPPRQVEGYAQRMRRQGNPVTTAHFPNSGHVRHIATDRVRYEACLQDFCQHLDAETRSARVLKTHSRSAR